MKYELKEDDIVDLGSYRGKAIKMALPNRSDYIQRSIAEGKKLYVEKDFSSLLNMLPVNPSVVDIGAYTGSSSLWFASVAGARRVVAVEPDEYFCSILNSNVAINGLSDVIDVVNAAIGEENGYAEKYVTSSSNFGATRYTKCDNTKLDKVRMTTIDELSDDKIDILHISMEGNEYSAINGAKRVITEDKPLIVMTLWSPTTVPRIDPGYDSLYAYTRLIGSLAKYNYRIYGKFGEKTVFKHD